VQISEIRVKLVETSDSKADKLRAFCSVTFNNEIVIRDLKVIEGGRGLFIAMPSRKLMGRCNQCGAKNPMRARYCNDCGSRQPRREDCHDPASGRRLYADVAHPIHARARDALQRAVVEAYLRELQASRQEGYVPPSFEDLDYDSYGPAAPRGREARESGEAEASG